MTLAPARSHALEASSGFPVRPLILASVMIAGLAAAGPPVAGAQTDEPPASRVRSTNPAITALIAHASAQSQTFRELVDTINNSDGIVYVEEDDCGFGVRACLTGVTTAGENRVLWIRVETHGVDWDVMGAIGHELRHAVEVLDEPSVNSTAAMMMFYLRIGWRSPNRTFETNAAIKAGDAIRGEVQEARRADEAS